MTETTARIIPYTYENDTTPDPDMSGLVMIAIGLQEDGPYQVLDRIPEGAAKVLCGLLDGATPPALSSPAPAVNAELLHYVLQDDLNNRLTPRIIDIAYTAFTAAKEPNKEDGGPSDWFTDTRPRVDRLIAKLRAELLTPAPVAAPAMQEEALTEALDDADDADKLARTLCDAISGLFAGLSSDRRSGIEHVMAGYIRAALSASQERERALREAHTNAMGQLNCAIYRARHIAKWHADPNCDVKARAEEVEAHARAAKEVLVAALQTKEDVNGR